ncbi:MULTISPECIES: DUF7551 domain-containing protein [Haloferax]|uniref:Uncharacterized protein n=1 Tax=Haloferax lucentense (strain DSM 14919 / JCM 9276 / NCIMB 13854 / Aa 2.2) TaxID=1230452 RepID=M0GVR3_HALL2|nr:MULTISPECIES: hypothetical protein [Haloferax]ELZ74939.1 hypothetical protein C456_08283 [Haloferax lucentense DSM 14919]MBC9986485.1 hypothetical protein [Haloferax sp. AS1]RDZ39279.1 hypothetical protein C5B89_12210 [Haloferax sp. Atlit-47N]WEL29891.1 Uncharacterized protein HBNXHx_1785 [Haloferax alexandrinus]
MVGTTLTQIRTHIESLASDDGTYELVCGRTGERPVPVDGLRFEDRETAEAAARAARKYRSALRRYDPNVPYYDLIVSEHDSRSGFGGATATAEGWATAGATPGLPEPPCDLGTDAGGRTECAADGDRSERVEFCHRVAAAVFEALVDADHRAVETAVMDAYFDLAETMSSADDLCLRLLESMATALHVHLASAEQADVLERAASNLASRPDATKTLAATLAEMERLDLVESYTCSAWRSGPDATTRAAELTLEGYALSAREGRLPVLPVVLELYRRTSSWRPVSLHVTSTEGGWHATLSVSSASSAVGLASVPIHEHAAD